MPKGLRLMGSIVMVLGASAEAADTTAKPPENLCIGSQCSFATQPVGVQSRSAADFVDSIGVNVHFNQVKTPYVRLFPLVKQKLLESGIKHVRDGAVDSRGGFPSKDQAAIFRELGEAGIRVTFIFDANVNKEFVQGYPAHVAPSFEAYEYPNELNAKQDIDWAGTLRTWAPLFQSYIRSNPSDSAKFPVIGPSLVDVPDPTKLPDLSQYMDYGNIHAYYISHHPATVGWGPRGVAPCHPWRYGALGYKMCNARRVAGSRPIMATEAGWGTEATTKNPVPEVVQAKYLTRMLLNHFEAGIARTHIYQFIDSGNDTFQSFGLLGADGREKPAFHAVKSLLAALHDSFAVASPSSVEINLGGDTSDVRVAVFEKSDGSFRAILWIEKSGFDPAFKTLIAVPERTLYMQLGSGMLVKSAVTWLDSGRTSVSNPDRSAAGVYSLRVTDRLLLLELTR